MKQFCQGTPRTGLGALSLCDSRHHPGLRPVGDHADQVEQQPLTGWQGIQLLILAKFGDPDLLWGVRPLTRQACTLSFKRLDLGLKPVGRPAGCAGGRPLQQVGDPDAQPAEPGASPGG